MHVAFGEVLTGDFDTPEALAAEIDRQIHDNYRLFPMNHLAAKEGGAEESVKKQLEEKLAALPEGAHQYLLDSYANPVKNQA